MKLLTLVLAASAVYAAPNNKNAKKIKKSTAGPNEKALLKLAGNIQKQGEGVFGGIFDKINDYSKNKFEFDILKEFNGANRKGKAIYKRNLKGQKGKKFRNKLLKEAERLAASQNYGDEFSAAKSWLANQNKKIDAAQAQLKKNADDKNTAQDTFDWLKTLVGDQIAGIEDDNLKTEILGLKSEVENSAQQYIDENNMGGKTLGNLVKEGREKGAEQLTTFLKKKRVLHKTKGQAKKANKAIGKFDLEQLEEDVKQSGANLGITGKKKF